MKSLARIKGKTSDWLAAVRDGRVAARARQTEPPFRRLVGRLRRHVCDRVRRFLNRRAKRGGRSARELLLERHLREARRAAARARQTGRATSSAWIIGYESSN